MATRFFAITATGVIAPTYEQHKHFYYCHVPSNLAAARVHTRRSNRHLTLRNGRNAGSCNGKSAMTPGAVLAKARWSHCQHPDKTVLLFCSAGTPFRRSVGNVQRRCHENVAMEVFRTLPQSTPPSSHWPTN